MLKKIKTSTPCMALMKSTFVVTLACDQKRKEDRGASDRCNSKSYGYTKLIRSETLIYLMHPSSDIIIL
jgi:hypothetical protein